MGVRKYRGQIVCDKWWPDGSRIIRVCGNRTQAKQLLDRIAALEAVNLLPPMQGCPYVFYNIKSKDRWHDCRKPWREARRKVGLPQILVKDLRRHYAINLAEDGANMHDIQSVLGHASVATTEKHYAHPNTLRRRF